MKKTKKFSLLCLSALFLASCANGGTSSPSVRPSSTGASAPSNQPVNPPDSTPSNSGSSSTTNSSTTDPAQTFTVTLNAGTNGTLTETETTVTLNEAFTLPAPTANTNFVFRGWEYNGNLITGADGQGLDVWSIEQNVEVTAKYAQTYRLTFIFRTVTPVVGTTTYYDDEPLFGVEVTENFNPGIIHPIYGWFSDLNSNTYVTSINDLNVTNNEATLYTQLRADEFLNATFTPEGVLTATNNTETRLLTTIDLGHLYMRGKKITGIGKDAFVGNTVVQSIYIPKTVTSIESGALSTLQNLTEINLEAAETDKPAGFLDDWNKQGLSVNWGVPPLTR